MFFNRCDNTKCVVKFRAKARANDASAGSAGDSMPPAFERGMSNYAFSKAMEQIASEAEQLAVKERADAIRAELLEQGIILEDTKEGTRWKRKA